MMRSGSPFVGASTRPSSSGQHPVLDATPVWTMTTTRFQIIQAYYRMEGHFYLDDDEVSYLQVYRRMEGNGSADQGGQRHWPGSPAGMPCVRQSLKDWLCC